MRSIKKVLKDFCRISLIVGALTINSLYINNCSKELVVPDPGPHIVPNLPVEFFNNNIIKWVDYAPTNFNPEINQFPSTESIQQDLEKLHEANFNGVVTYGSDGSLSNIPNIAKDLGFEYVIAGIWDINSLEEWNNVINSSQYIDGFCMGNEGLSRGDYTLSELESKINELKEATNKPTTTTEPLGEYNNITLLELGDWVFPNAHPYWQGITDPNLAVDWTIQQYEDISLETDKIVVFKEIGLPSDGEAGLDENVQNEYYRSLEELMSNNSKTSFIYFEAFDQPWKDWSPVEPHWGLFKDDRSTKKVSEPQILYTFVPEINTYDNLKGRVVNIKPGEYKISTYILVGNTWWMKPYWNRPLTTISGNSNWVTDITTGGIDKTATKINSYTVTPDYEPVAHVLPQLEDEKVINFISVDR